MDYNGAIAYLDERATLGSRPGLSNITRLCSLLGNPQNELRFIHISGTNGKGSVAAFIGEILKAAGYATGVFTSPHLERLNETITVNGAEITDAEFAAVCKRVKCIADMMAKRGEGRPTQFEIVTAMALYHFAEAKCDFAVIETGLGGRLDATNVINADTAVITPIDYDHTDVLGETLSEIAFEKSGIIKKKALVVTCEQQDEAMNVIEETCAKRGAKLYKAEYAGMKISLIGEHQYVNAALAAKTAEILRIKGAAIPESAIKKGLLNAKIAGRFELFGEKAIVDGAHNLHGVRALAAALRSFCGDKKIVFVMGVLADKDYKAMIDCVLPLSARFYTVTPNNPRALGADELAEEIRKRGKHAVSCRTVSEALAAALATSLRKEAVCCFGSLYFIGEARSLLITGQIDSEKTQNNHRQEESNA